MNIRKYVVPEVVFGDNSLEMVGRFAQNFGAKKVLIVTDNNIINAGWVNEVKESLEYLNLNYFVFTDLTPNPKDYEVEAGVELYKKENCNLIIAVGGGSVIDCAKGIGIVANNKENICLFEGVDQVKYPIPPLICIPTTAGSSADISQFAIIVNSKEKRKMAIISKSVVPDISLIDAITTTTMPIELTISSGIDALVHAIEAYVSNASSPLTDINAKEAIGLISEYLPKVVKEPYNMDYRNKVMLGSLLAGMAFSNASLGLVHAMAHSLGGLLDNDHGMNNVILLDRCINYNYDSAPQKYKDIYYNLYEAKPVDDDLILPSMLNYINEFRNKLNIKKKDLILGISQNDIKVLARNTYEDSCLATNPKDISIDQIEEIYEQFL